jgi:hypothetical protein
MKGVAMRMSVIFLAVFFGSTSLYAQPSSRQKVRAVEIPREIGLVAIAYQPNSPLQFEDVKFLAGIDGGGLTRYDLRNRTAKAISKLTIGDNIGGTWSWDVAKDRGPIMPGQLVPPWSDENWVETLPLTKELIEKLKLKGPMHGILVLMVIHVEFSDGSVYDDEPVYKALCAYMDVVQENEFKASRSNGSIHRK